MGRPEGHAEREVAIRKEELDQEAAAFELGPNLPLELEFLTHPKTSKPEFPRGVEWTEGLLLSTKMTDS